MSDPMPMSDLLREAVDRVEAELRVAFEEDAHAAPEARAARSDGIINAALRTLAPGEGEALLRALERRFPGTASEDSASASPPRGNSPPDADALVRALLELGGSMSAAQRAAIAQAFSGWASPSAGGGDVVADRPTELTPGRAALIEAVGVGPFDADPDRVAMVLALVWELACALDALGWGIWRRTFATEKVQPPLRPRLDLRATLVKLLNGSLNAPPALVASAVAELQGLLAGLVVAGEKEARDGAAGLATLRPEAIEASVDARLSSARQKAECWEEFCRRAQASDSPLARSAAERMVAIILNHMPRRR